MSLNKTFYRTLVMLVVACTLTACESTGDQLKGTWKGSMPASYEEGTSQSENIYFKFTLDDGFNSNEGDYIEMRDGTLKDDESVDYPLQCHYVYYLKGRWRVEDVKNLHTIPDVGTLHVKVIPNEFKTFYDGAWHTYSDVTKAYESGEIGVSADELVDAITKDIKESLTETIKEKSNNAYKTSFGVTIDGDKMDFESSDVGTLKFSKSTTDLMDIFNSDKDL